MCYGCFYFQNLNQKLHKFDILHSEEDNFKTYELE